MKKLLLHTLAQAIPLLFIVSSLTYFLVSLIPGSVATALLGIAGTPAQYRFVEKQLGLNQPVYEQYWRWLDRVFHGSLGSSLQNRQSVVSILDSRLSTTITLIVATVVVVAVVGVSIGVIASRSKGILGRAFDLLSWTGLSMPNFCLALLLVTLFSVHWRLLPAVGFASFSSSPWEWLKSLILPVTALALGPIAIVAKQTRDSMITALSSEYIRTLRASGVSERSIVIKHALRNASLPVVSVLGVLFVSLLGGTVVVETVFGLPGLGSLAVSAVGQHDLPVVEGVAVYFTIIVIAANLIVDLAYGWLSPKIRVR